MESTKKAVLLLLLVIGIFHSAVFSQEIVVGKMGKLENDIYSSIFSGDLKGVIIAIVAGADMNIQDEYGDTPLISSIYNSKSNIVQYLISRGVKLDTRNIEGDTAISAAVAMNDLAVLKILVGKQENIQTYNKNGEGLLEIAIKKKKYDMLSYLLKEKLVDKDQISPMGFTPLSFACLFGDVQAAKILLNKDADIDKRANETARTPLMISASLGNVEMLSLLIKEGAETDMLDGYGRNALSIAIAASQKDAAFLLLKSSSRSEYESVDVYGQSPLTLAIATSMSDLAMSIIDKGADVNTANIYGQTPLMVAASHGNLSLLQFMVNKEDGDLSAVVTQSFTEILSKKPYKALTYLKGWNILDIAEEALQTNVVSYLIFEKGLVFNKSLERRKMQGKS